VSSHIRRSVDQARRFAAHGDDAAAKQAYLDVLRVDPTYCPVLIELGALACASGHRSAARTAYAQAVHYHPGNPIGRVSLANLLFEDGDVSGARLHFEAALGIDPDFPEAHQGLARVLTELEDGAADAHWRKGFVGHAIVTRRYRGIGPGIPLLLLVAARGGNIPTQQWIDERIFAVTAIYADFHDAAQPVPPHALVVNAIGDADLCRTALTRAEELAACSAASVINAPARVRETGRADNARRLAGVPGMIVPAIAVLQRSSLLRADGLTFPLLLRPPGFHTGRHFRYVADQAELAGAATDMPGDELLAIEYLDARGVDGMARKYRVMFIDGVAYPLHLAISADWKVHYFTAAMATSAAYRAEERRFLDDMSAVLGARAMAALAGIGAALGLDYAGVDFALAPDGSVLLFEANATMVIVPPDSDPIWDYRRRAVADVLEAAKQMLLRRVNLSAVSRSPAGSALPSGPAPAALHPLSPLAG
jgi:hypothetical protein